ncbi:MAG: DeoR/GlpR family DNA-binding transcription regulator [Lachnospiraceae bacterium]|nr:DeoR/GlpR family DNA-binding transcription regulator [Lachnospiraceae bacterium]
MLAIERRNEILGKLQNDKRVIVSELSDYYEVSEETIRRDLEKLEKDGYVTKSYGGAILNENINLEMPFNVRKNTNVVGKQRIAALLTELVNDGDSLMLDSSSTAVFIAKALKETKRNLTIITNSIEIIIELFDAQEWRVLSTGGLAQEGSFALVGPQTDQMLSAYHVSKAIISCKGFDIHNGITDSNELHARNKQTMLNRTEQGILAVDKSKFGKTAFALISRLDNISIIVTDEKPEEKWLRLFEEYRIKCIWP